MKKGGLTARISVAIWGVPLILGVTFFGGIPLIGLIFVLIILGQIEYYKLQLKIGQKPLITIGICCGIVVYAAWFISLFTVLTALIGSFLLIAIVGTLRNRTHVDIATTFTGIMYLPVLIGIFPVIRAARFPGIDEGAHNQRKDLVGAVAGEDHFLFHSEGIRCRPTETSRHRVGIETQPRHVASRKRLPDGLAGRIGVLIRVELDVPLLLGLLARHIGGHVVNRFAKKAHFFLSNLTSTE